MKHYKDSENNLYAYELDGSQDHLIPSHYVAVTDVEAEAIREANRLSQLSNLDYKNKRALEYPTFADQFDLLYHGGMDAWKAAIQAVKDKYPKV
jgi:hypothetical protein